MTRKLNSEERRWLAMMQPVIDAVREAEKPGELAGFRFMRMRRAFREFAEKVIADADHDVRRMRKAIVANDELIEQLQATIAALEERA